MRDQLAHVARYRRLVVRLDVALGVPAPHSGAGPDYLKSPFQRVVVSVPKLYCQLVVAAVPVGRQCEGRRSEHVNIMGLTL